MKEGWKTQRLNDACIINYGTRVVKKKDGGSIYPVYGGGGATFKMDTFNRENCLVVSRFAMSEKCTRFVEGKFFLNDSGLTVGVNDSALSQPFLNWILLFKNDEIYSFGKGSAQKNLDMDDFRNMLISYPLSLSEQQRIVSLLEAEFEKIDRLRSNAELNLKNAEAILQAAIQEELRPKEGWDMVYLGELCECITKGTTPTSIGFSFTKEGVNFVKAETFTDKGEILLDKISHISDDCNRVLSRSQLKEMDILFSIAGVLGRTAIVSKSILPANTNQALAIIRLKEPSISFAKYLSHYFKSEVVLNQIEKDKKGAAQYNLSLAQLKALPIFLPPRIVQKEIVATLDVLSAKCKILQDNFTKTIALCDDLKQALLRKAFNGEL